MNGQERTPRNSAAIAIIAMLGGAPAGADVLDLTAGEFGNRDRARGGLVSTVLDLDRPPPPEPEPAEEAEVADTSVAVMSTMSAGKRRGSAEIEALIQDVALQYAAHPGLRRAGMSSVEWMAFFRANIAIESNFRQSAVSHVGAIGLGQLMPETARVLGVNPHDPVENLHGSARYLLAQLERFGSRELALAAYNAGPEAVVRHGGIPPYRETQGHVRRVLAIYSATSS